MLSMALSPMPYPKPAIDATARRTVPLMGTFVSINVLGPSSLQGQPSPEIPAAVDRALEWFRRVEQCCSRFEPGSEAMQLASTVGVAVPASPILYEAVQFALAVAEETRGAFDPTVGQAMEIAGFNRDYHTGRAVQIPAESTGSVTYRDIRLDPTRKTITLLCPLVLDLGAVAKGLAIDLAARELQPFENFAIDAGGDLYVSGCNRQGEPWSLGIRHPRRDNDLIGAVRVSNCAVCTSGDYERHSPTDPATHHILEPRSGVAAQSVASATVIAPTAMMADALSTAAFVLGPNEGIRLFERMGVEGLIFTPTLERFATKGFPSAF
jgi:FAD:protein FMN transferase